MLYRLPMIAVLLCLVGTVAAAAEPAEGGDAEPAGIGELDTNEAESTAAEGQDEERESIADDVLVEKQNCISISRIRNTDILDDRRIVFYMQGSEIYLNHLPRRCPGLRIHDSFGYDVRTGQLCNVDTIAVIESFGGSFRQGVRCGLGKFQPITAEQLESLREADPVED